MIVSHNTWYLFDLKRVGLFKISRFWVYGQYILEKQKYCFLEQKNRKLKGFYHRNIFLVFPMKGNAKKSNENVSPMYTFFLKQKKILKVTLVPTLFELSNGAKELFKGIYNNFEQLSKDNNSSLDQLTNHYCIRWELIKNDYLVHCELTNKNWFFIHCGLKY